jgi:hypothetical protein
MNIEYLTFYKENLEKINGGKYVIPFNEDIMDELVIIGYTFPKAYQEFMYLSIGKPRIFDSGINCSIRYAIVRQKKIKEFLKKEYNFSIDKDFWIIAELDLEQFDFFYINDPDAEDKENPPVYFFKGYEIEDGEEASEANISLSYDTFSEYVKGNASVRMEEKGFSVE